MTGLRCTLDRGRCAEVLPGVLRAWVPARALVGTDDARLMVGVPWDLKPITEPQCYPDAMVAALIGEERWLRFQVSALGRRLAPERSHRPGLCRRCGFYADAAPGPPDNGNITAEVVLVGRVRRCGQCCFGQEQTVVRVWLPGWCGHPRSPELEGRESRAEFYAGVDWSDDGQGDGVALCRHCANHWIWGPVVSPVDLAARLGVPVRWHR